MALPAATVPAELVAARQVLRMEATAPMVAAEAAEMVRPALAALVELAVPAWSGLPLARVVAEEEEAVAVVGREATAAAAESTAEAVAALVMG